MMMLLRDTRDNDSLAAEWLAFRREVSEATAQVRY
jgi:hypothetical protein